MQVFVNVQYFIDRMNKIISFHFGYSCVHNSSAVKVSTKTGYGHVLRRDDGNVLRKALEFKVKGMRK